MYQSLDNVPITLGKIIAQNIERNPRRKFDDYAVLRKKLRPTKDIDWAIIMGMTVNAKDSRHIRETLSLAAEWSSQDRGNYCEAIIKEMDSLDKIDYRIWAETIKYYQRMLPEEKIPPILKAFLVEKAMAASAKAGTTVDFCNSHDAFDWDFKEVSLAKMNWPMEVWRIIFDSDVPTSIKKIAWEKIEGLRFARKNHKIH